jgi:hypothetical protein
MPIGPIELSSGLFHSVGTVTSRPPARIVDVVAVAGRRPFREPGGTAPMSSSLVGRGILG